VSTSASATFDTATATMLSLVGSLADNKGALGRRYGEWAVSAPTIESAVAAAAMAQDELGHARSTYPVLAKLGVERQDEGLDVGRPMHVIEQPLRDWASVIAANLVVDGILTTFVAGARTSSIEPLAQRARKILQEEGSHRVHAEAWLRRMCRSGGADRRLLGQRVGEMWAEASRWPGPPGDPGYTAAMTQSMVRDGPDEVRRRVREWLAELLAAEGMEMVLEDPTDWSQWDAQTRRLGAPSPGGAL
jgi:1,2-phenylacetyl-CoA epoxidase catalytic subunit